MKSSNKLQRTTKAAGMKAQRRRPHRSNVSISNIPAGNSVALANANDTNTDPGKLFKEYT